MLQPVYFFAAASAFAFVPAGIVNDALSHVTLKPVGWNDIVKRETKITTKRAATIVLMMLNMMFFLCWP